jgi:hypothetical protein
MQDAAGIATDKVPAKNANVGVRYRIKLSGSALLFVSIA